MKEFDVEYTDTEGDNYEESFNTKSGALQFIKGLYKEDCRVVQTWIYINGEYKGSFY